MNPSYPEALGSATMFALLGLLLRLLVSPASLRDNALEWHE